MYEIPKGDTRYLFNSTKLAWHMDRVDDYFNKNKRIAPLYIDAGIAKFCNVKCIFCYGIYQNPSRELIPENALISFLRDAPKLGVKAVGLVGDGEPTMNPALYQGVAEGKKNGLDIGVATNGVALDKDKILTLVDNVVWVRFNCAAAETKAYQKIHGKDYWLKVKKNIEDAVRINKKNGSKCTLGLQTIYMPQTFDQIYKQAKWARDIGLDYFEIKQFSDPGCDDMARFDQDWYDQGDVKEELEKVEKLSNDKTHIVAKWSLIQAKQKRPYKHCLAIPFLFEISGNGEIYPCGYLFNNKNFLMGDLKVQSLKEILESDRYWKVIDYMRNDFDVHNDCQGCCRQDFSNKFLYDYLYDHGEYELFIDKYVRNREKPDHLNFI